MKIFFFLVLVAAIGAGAALYVLSSKVEVAVEPAVKVIGQETPLHIRVSNAHEVRSLDVALEQDGKSYPIQTGVANPRKWLVFRGKPVAQAVDVRLGKATAPALHDGKASVRIAAVSNDLRGQTSAVAFEVDVMTAPPRVVADGAQHYINQGGAEMVTFSPSGSWAEAGVEVGDHKFPAHALPDHPGQYFSLFAFSWNLPQDTPVTVYASNPAGGVAKASFWYKVFPKKFRQSTIPLETMHIERIVNQIDPGGKIKGTNVERFVWINSELRKQNTQKLVELGRKSEEKFLWTGAFLPLLDSTVESRFADDRVYTWEGKKVDEQTHLGFDLAKVAHAPIPAANDGKVVWAEDLGIYGNCVVIDHGFGLQTLYGHMSEFAVKSGDMVKKGQIIGKTGSTGLAGGDHLHFSMLIDGVQVNAVEWWDPHWVRDRILSRMGVELAADAAPAVKAASSRATASSSRPAGRTRKKRR